MASSSLPNEPRLRCIAITLPRKEMNPALDAEKSQELASMEFDGLDPSRPHMPASDFVYISIRTTGPYKVREVKDLQLVIKSGYVTISQLERVKAWRDTRAKETGYEMVEKVDAIEEEAKEVLIFDEAKEIKDNYIEILKL